MQSDVHVFSSCAGRLNWNADDGNSCAQQMHIGHPGLSGLMYLWKRRCSADDMNSPGTTKDVRAYINLRCKPKD